MGWSGELFKDDVPKRIKKDERYLQNNHGYKQLLHQLKSQEFKVKLHFIIWSEALFGKSLRFFRKKCH